MPTQDTNIGWTDSTWNPVHGCHKVSEGCANCYAAAQSQRFEHTEKPWTVENAEDNVMLQMHHLEYPVEKEPRRIFVNSMSDLFHDLVPDEYIHRIMDVIEEADQHVFQALTKHGCETGQHRTQPRITEWDEEYGRWPDNLWMGVSVENENRAYRAQSLALTDAAVKWVSFEPLVDEVTSLGALTHMDWAVIGGESGSEEDRRHMDHAWARQVRDAARANGVPVYFKQSSAASPEQGRALAEQHADYREAKLAGGELTRLREFPDAFTDALEAARPELANKVIEP
jgi:protein gp37